LKNYPKFEEAHLGIAAVLIAQQKLDLAVSHLQQAIALDATNEVAWYRLSRAENMLGNRAEREKALAEFKRLRSVEATEKRDRLVVSPDEITRQKLDPNVQP
jgi:DNA-binding SARP family transcriptional activator